LLYVIEDNYPRLSVETVVLRGKAVATGKMVTGLIHSTESRKPKITRLLSPIFHLISPM
jgi:hypothetical protein